MASSRTGLTPHLRFRKAVLRGGIRDGVTHCPICNVELDYKVTRTPASAEPDHIIPITKGGTNEPSNGRVICRLCNQKRGNKGLDEKPRTPRKVRAIKASPIW